MPTPQDCPIVDEHGRVIEDIRGNHPDHHVNRWVQLGLSMLVSAVTAGFSVSWGLSSTLSTMQGELKAIEARTVRLENDVKSNDGRIDSQAIAHATTVATLSQVSSSVSEMSRKVDEIYRLQVQKNR